MRRTLAQNLRVGPISGPNLSPNWHEILLSRAPVGGGSLGRSHRWLWPLGLLRPYRPDGPGGANALPLAVTPHQLQYATATRLGVNIFGLNSDRESCARSTSEAFLNLHPAPPSPCLYERFKFSNRRARLGE